MDSKIILVKNIHIDRQYTNVLDYTEAQMLELCTQNMIVQANDYSFIRTSRTIMTNFKYGDALKANYIAFQNPDYSNKWFFAWIDDVIFKGNYNTEISYTIDSWSTWFDYWKPKTCLVTREHVNNDTIGLHTVDENINVGRVVSESFDEIKLVGDDIDEDVAFYYAINSTYNPITKEDFKGATRVNGNLQGNWIFLFSPQAVQVKYLDNFLSDINSQGKIDSVSEVYVVPSLIVDEIGTKQLHKDSTLADYYVDLLLESKEAILIDKIINKTNTFNDYVPKNNKCFVYPYNYLLVSNNIGNNIIYKYEDFSDDNANFIVENAISIGGSSRLVPKNYKGISANYEESIPLAKYPTCSWASDAFTNWLSSNAVNITTNIVSSIASVASQGATGLATVASNTANLIGQFYQANLLPSIQGGSNSGDVNFSVYKNSFSIYHMRARKEYIKIIDDYFTRFGYKLDEVLVPNLNGRRYWNYIEIGSAEEIGYGEVPSRFMDIINNACRRGVTIWHNHANIGNFNLDNSII